MPHFVTYPTLKESASFKIEEFINTGNGYFSYTFEIRIIASHCSPISVDRKPTVIIHNKADAFNKYVNVKNIITHTYL